jgi:hypothetical protein
MGGARERLLWLVAVLALSVGAFRAGKATADTRVIRVPVPAQATAAAPERACAPSSVAPPFDPEVLVRRIREEVRAACEPPAPSSPTAATAPVLPPEEARAAEDQAVALLDRGLADHRLGPREFRQLLMLIGQLPTERSGPLRSKVFDAINAQQLKVERR